MYLVPQELVSGGGTMGDLIRSRAWEDTNVGPISQWPTNLLKHCLCDPLFKVLLSLLLSLFIITSIRHILQSISGHHKDIAHCMHHLQQLYLLLPGYLLYQSDSQWSCTGGQDLKWYITMQVFLYLCYTFLSIVHELDIETLNLIRYLVLDTQQRWGSLDVKYGLRFVTS